MWVFAVTMTLVVQSEKHGKCLAVWLTTCIVY